MKIARQYLVEGRVQGVGFRFFVEHTAAELNLAGYVKNLYDGSVEVYAVGDLESLDLLRGKLEQGPRGAHVSAVRESPAVVRDYKSFQIAF